MSFFRSGFGFLCMAVCTTGFSGFVPRMYSAGGTGGGTIGSLLTIIALICFHSHLTFARVAAAMVATLAIGSIATHFGERFMIAHWGKWRRHTGAEATYDFNETNIDEVHGMLFAALPIYVVHVVGPWESILLHLAAFGLFRIFDTWKPWPIRHVEAGEAFLTKAGAVMLDDTVAGFFAAVVLSMLLIFIAALLF